MTLQQLRYVVAVSHYGSINAAAQNLFIAQSSISKSIKDLEEEVGITIFERGHGGVAFTADGMELLGYANAILEQTSNLQERFRGQGADSFNYSEEIFVPEEMGKRVYVTDRSALLSIIRNTNAYSTGSGCLLPSVIHTDIVSIPLRGRVDRMQVGWIQLNSMVIPPEMVEYIQGMERSIRRCVWGSQN